MIKLTIPVYHTIERKTKKDKTFLVSLNWYRNAYYYEQNNVKTHFHYLIKEQLKDTEVINGKYQVTYHYYYKNGASDLANVTPMCSKWVNDVLQDMDIVANDNVNYMVKETHQVIKQDKEHPRCEIFIEQITEDSE